ncbi:phage tail protein [Kineothrix sedimenti]|uniref:Phage tail protein n=1 Tax=Kineothrix sedimenti TaxID=3123317 RepID=A0ABZ3EZX8_9FIRM
MALDVIGLSLAKSYTASSLEGAGALKGDPGKSAYEIDVSNGFTGTEAEWLESIKGEKGDDGQDGIYVTSMNISEDNKVTALLSNGNTLQVGTLNTVKGDKGDSGAVPRIDDETKRWFIGDYDTGYVAVPNTEISFNDLTDFPMIPIALSQLTNDENFIKNTVNNLINYYTKAETYTKAEISNLVSNINRLTTSIVTELPTEDISTTTIYLISAGESIYNQFMYIEGEWVTLGNTNMNLSGYVTSSELSLALAEKSDINHTHGTLHSHENKALLDTITSELIQKWNSKFSGNYNDLTNKPIIPHVTNDLTDELREGYDDAVNKKHAHNNNLSVLDKFSEGVDGKPLYNNSPIGGEGGGNSGANIDDEITSTTTTWSSQKISDRVQDVEFIADNISIAQKSTNKRGYTNLLSSEIELPLTKATALGTAVSRAINLDVTLLDDITNYNMIEIVVSLKNSSIDIEPTVNMFNVSSIKYNDSDIINDQNGSLLKVSADIATTSAGAYGHMNCNATMWFKDSKKLFIYITNNPSTSSSYTGITILSIKGINFDSVVIDPVEHVNTTNGIEDTPVGHIITQMGVTAPNHYLNCDGTIYNIVDYPYLSQYIKDQFGTFNYFGGNGTTTFAVPDLRGEFLRGTGAATRNTGTGASVGVHQDPTSLPGMFPYATSSGYNSLIIDYKEEKKSNSFLNADSNLTNSARFYKALDLGTLTQIATPYTYAYTTRPTNTAVLYCIKYEPTYFMSIQGLIEETTLWEGSVGTATVANVTNTISLIDSITNFDKIGLEFIDVNPNSSLVRYNRYVETLSNTIKKAIDLHSLTQYVSFPFSINEINCLTDIKAGESTYNSFVLIQSCSYITKVIGIKYKTFD